MVDVQKHGINLADVQKHFYHGTRPKTKHVFTMVRAKKKKVLPWYMSKNIVSP